MMWSRRAFGVCAVLGTGLLAVGCAQVIPSELPQSRDTPFLLSTDQVESTVGSRTSRSQVPEPVPSNSTPPSLPGLPPATNPAAQPPPALPPQTSLLKDAPPVTPNQTPVVVTPPIPDAPPGAEIRQVSNNVVSAQRIRFGASVRAWVNGKPIFDDEIQCSIPREMVAEAGKLPPGERETAFLKIIRQVADGLIDQELLVQELMRKVEKQPKALEHFQSAAKKEVQKRIASQVRQTHLNSVQELEEKLAESGSSLATVKRVIERQFLSEIYVHNRVEGALAKIGNDEIREYYNDHRNMFMNPDKVKWQNIFIAVGPKHPTLADARKFAEQVMAQWRSGADISKLLELDDGESQSRSGAGAGELRGDIRPRELEPLLFAMNDGEFGPLYELPTGVHLYRLVKREVAGVMPLDERLQTRIGNILKNEIFDLERKQIINFLRTQAGDGVVIVERTPGQ
jgi:peptidyl-prolyl cis-trans isomerase SurA